MKKALVYILVVCLLAMTLTAYGESPWQEVEDLKGPIEVFVERVVSAWGPHEIVVRINDPALREQANVIEINVDRFNGIIMVEDSGLKVNAMNLSGDPIDPSNPGFDRGLYAYDGAEEIVFKVLPKTWYIEDSGYGSEESKYANFEIKFHTVVEFKSQKEFDEAKGYNSYKEFDDGSVVACWNRMAEAKVTYEVAAPSINVLHPYDAYAGEEKLKSTSYVIYNDTRKDKHGRYEPGTDERSYQYNVDIWSGGDNSTFLEGLTEKAPEELVKHLGMDEGYMTRSVSAPDYFYSIKGYEKWKQFNVKEEYMFLADGKTIKFFFTEYSSTDDAGLEAASAKISKTFEEFIKGLEVVEQFEGDYAIPKVDRTGPAKYKLIPISTDLTVFNNGMYNTYTKMDSNFYIAARIEKSGNYKDDEVIYAYGQIQENPGECAIGFRKGSGGFSDTITYRVNDDSVGLLIGTKGTLNGKISGKDFKNEENVTMSLRDASGTTISNTISLKVRIADAAPTIVFNEKTDHEIQSEGEATFDFKVEDPDSLKLKVKVSTPFGAAKTSDGKWQKTLEFTTEPGKNITLGFKAPEVGNFLLNKEMEDLSMKALQEGTILQAIADIETVALDKFLAKAAAANNTAKRVGSYGLDMNNFSEKSKFFKDMLARKQALDKWKRISGRMNDINNAAFASQTQQQMSAMGQEIYQASTFKNKTITEAGSDIGIAAITLLQTGVGGFAAVAGYFSGKDGESLGIASDKMAIFNLMTNVWKGNLKYWSKAEKIDRAEEKKEMIPVLVEVEDESGFKSKAVFFMTVVGLEV